jgi:eukaryotic-like serine/threonine-protein kinase
MADDVSRLTSAVADRYQIDREIGRGGMATVYLARDIRHHRNVALKVLNPELGAVLGVERFLAEIQVTANLQHPNLLPLFDSGEVNGLLYYVMPYIDGESLRARLEREKQLPVDEAVRIASAIASALDYAHRHHVIHRDLKPENILMHEGQPLIADFGIALAVSNAGGARITQTGLSLGTPQYMSPEQATGDRIVDGRTDIYSLGAMTYEMLAGDPPHVASTSQAIIAKLLTEKPASLRVRRPSVPAHVDAAVGRALEKLAADRFATAREFADSLNGRGGPVTIPTSYEPIAAGAGASRGWRVRDVAPWLVTALFAAIAVAGYVWRPTPVQPPVIRSNFDLPPGVRINDVITGTTIAVSPKGDMIAFTSISGSGFRMYVRRVSDLEAREVAPNAGRNLTFSPDGRWIAFTEGNLLKKVAVDGGQIATVGTTGSAVPYGLSWSESGRIYVGSFSGIWSVPETGGTTALISTSDSTQRRTGKRWPLVLPGGKAIAYASGSSTSAVPHLSILTLADGKVKEFDLVMAVPLGIHGEQLVYVSPVGALMAVPFDNSARRAKGDPVQLDEGVLMEWTAGAKASLSSSGTIAYLRGRAEFQPVRVSPGSATPVPMIQEAATYTTPRFSPDGGRVAITMFGSASTDIWVYHVARNTFTRLTNEGVNERPEWTSDGRYVVFISTRDGKTGIWRQPADGSGQADLLYQPDLEPFEAIISPDMKWILYRTAPGARYSRDIFAVPYGGERTVTPVVVGPETESMPRLSPDGKWLVYQSNETGRFEIYVRPFPQSGSRIQVSDNGGTEPIWGRNGKTLYYRGLTGGITEVSVTTGADFSIGSRKVVLTGDYIMDSTHPNYDVAPDGQFLMLKRAGAEAQTVVVHNWGRELREKTSPGK